MPATYDYPEPGDPGKRGAVMAKNDLEERAYHIYNAGVNFARQDRRGEAIAKYEAALALMPYLMQAHNNLGLLKPGAAGARHHEFLIGLAEEAGDTELLMAACNNLGLYYYDASGEKEVALLDKAIALYRRAVAADPATPLPDAVYNMANAYAAKGDHMKAIHIFNDLLAIKPDHHGAMMGLGNTYLRFGHAKKAAPYHRAAVASSRHPVEKLGALNNLGQSLKEQGDIPGGLGAHLQALALSRAAAASHARLVAEGGGNAAVEEGPLNRHVRLMQTSALAQVVIDRWYLNDWSRKDEEEQELRRAVAIELDAIDAGVAGVGAPATLGTW